MDACMFVLIALAAMLAAVLGGNNFSTCLGSSIGARVVKLSDATLIASAGVFLGAILEGGKLSNVLGQVVVSELAPSSIVVILLSALLVMTTVTSLRLPLSLSQVLMGATWGLAIATQNQISLIYSAWIISSWVLAPVVAFAIAIMVELIALHLGGQVKNVLALNHIYGIFTLAAGFYASYTLGANTLGFMVGLIPPNITVHPYLPILLALCTITGLVFFSRGIARRVADNLVGLTPTTAFSAQFSGAIAGHLFTQLRMPISISQAVIGGMNGASITKRMAITNRESIREIVVGWVLGPTAGATVAFLLTKIFS